MKKVVIVGANHAGTAATNTILDNSKDHQVTVFYNVHIELDTISEK